MKLEKVARKWSPKSETRNVSRECCGKIKQKTKFALKFFSENKLEIATENQSCAENGNWQSLCAQVDVCNQPITAVTRNGKLSAKFTFIFRRKYYLSGKYKVPKFATSCSRGTLAVITTQTQESNAIFRITFIKRNENIIPNRKL